MNRKGFTLLELVTVIIIVGILAAAGVPLYLNYVEDAKIARAKATIDAIYSAERVHYQKTQGYWTATGVGQTEIENNLGIKIDPSINNDWTFDMNTYGSSNQFISITATGQNNASGLSTTFASDVGTFNN
jgi:prepilin-type N-terminal cleavage/methylation domain-containing protein